MSNCYICDEQNDVTIYYKLKPVMYIDPKIYTQPLTDDMKPICEKCFIPFIFERQMRFNTCAICQCYNRSSGSVPSIVNDNEIHSNMKDGNYYFNKELFPSLKNKDTLCKKCFKHIISHSDTKRIDVDKNFDRNNMQCTKCNVFWENAKFPKNSDVMCWANFSANNIFDYGLAGQFKLLSENDKFKNGDYLCNDCLKSMKYEAYLGTECEICHNKYPSLGYGMAGSHCAAWIYDTVISGGYGSKYDSMSERENVRFKKERPKHLPFGSLICDPCIDKLIHEDVCLYPECYDDDHDMSQYTVPIFTTLPTEKNMLQDEILNIKEDVILDNEKEEDESIQINLKEINQKKHSNSVEKKKNNKKNNLRKKLSR